MNTAYASKHLSANLAKTQIKEFLRSEKAEVLAIRGDWGVGKTFLWNECLKEAINDKEISRKKIAYVSLFGITSKDELKSEIFIKTSSIEDSSKKFSFSKISGIKIFFSPILRTLRENKKYGDFFNLVLAYKSIREMIICLDDLERTSLRLEEVFGIITELREEKNCKIMIIFNDKKLESVNKTKFSQYCEKTIDKEFFYKPTPDEAFDIVFPENDQTLKILTLKLKITNIRTLKKIKDYKNELSQMLENCDEKTILHVLRSLVLFAHLYFDKPESGPSVKFTENITFARKMNIILPVDKKDNKKIEWLDWLSEYGFDSSDNLACEISNFVKCGFKTDELKTIISEYNSSMERQNKFELYEDAWKILNESFDENADELIQKIYAETLNVLESITSGELLNIFWLLDELGEREKIEELLRLAEEKREPSFFAPEIFKRKSDASEYVISEFKRIYLSKNVDNRSIKEILLKIHEASGWNDQDLDRLGQLTVEEFYKLFKSDEWRGEDLRKCILQCLRMAETSSPRPVLSKISENATLALRKIAEEKNSAINRIRVRRLGVDID